MISRGDVYYGNVSTGPNKPTSANSFLSEYVFCCFARANSSQLYYIILRILKTALPFINNFTLAKVIKFYQIREHSARL